MEIIRLTPAASTRASTQAETHRWHDPSHDPCFSPQWGARPSEPSKVYFVPSTLTVTLSPSSSAHETTYLRNSRASGSRSPLAVSALAVSAFAVRALAVSALAVSAFAVRALAVSAFAVSAFSVVIADWTSSTSSASPPQPTETRAAETARPRVHPRADPEHSMIEASEPRFLYFR